MRGDLLGESYSSTPLHLDAGIREIQYATCAYLEFSHFVVKLDAI